MTLASGARLGSYEVLYDVTSDGQRFLISTPDSPSTPIVVVPNWAAGLKRQ